MYEPPVALSLGAHRATAVASGALQNQKGELEVQVIGMPLLSVRAVMRVLPRKSATVLADTFDGVTACALSCFEPTLFAGSRVAAYAPPPSAMNKASVAVTFA